MAKFRICYADITGSLLSEPLTVEASTVFDAVEAFAAQSPNEEAERIWVISGAFSSAEPYPNPNFNPIYTKEEPEPKPEVYGHTAAVAGLPKTLSNDSERLNALIALAKENNILLQKCRGWLCIIALPVVLGIVLLIIGTLASLTRL